MKEVNSLVKSESGLRAFWPVPDEDLVVDATLIVESRQRETQTAD
jgi:hypothetical protein